MKIIQILPILAFGDAVGNDTRALADVLTEAGYNTKIYAEIIDDRIPKGTALPYSKLGQVEENDIIIYHLSTGHALNDKIRELKGKKIIRYHNITPAHYFKNYDFELYKSCKEGLQFVKRMAKNVDYVLADSEYNKQDLLSYGYTCRIEVLPILIPFADYDKKPNEKVMNRYQDDYVNILFTGRIAPNKKQEDVIDAFYYYKKYINAKSRLFLVGTYPIESKYYAQLDAYVKNLGLEDVIFTGQVRFDEVLAYYRIADLFLCMSEHEGFCVPLIEAMYFDVPVLARNTSAIAGTLGGSGMLLADNNSIIAAEMMNRILTDEALRRRILYNQSIRLKDFQHDKIKTQFLKIIQSIEKDEEKNNK